MYKVSLCIYITLTATLTQMNNVGELNMAAAAVLVDAADSEAVFSLAGHIGASHLSLGRRLRGKAFGPLLGAHLLPLHHEDGAGGGGGGGGSRDPGEQHPVGLLSIHLDSNGAGRGAVTGSWPKKTCVFLIVHLRPKLCEP